MNPHKITQEFEERIAEYAGSKYAVAIDSCCNALFLCLNYIRATRVNLPKFTYPGVACSVINSGAEVRFSNKKWQGTYKLEPYDITDGALRFKKGMYKSGLHCLSFHAKKHLPIGRGGMILTDDFDAYWWFRKARFDGRSELPLTEDTISMVGWNCYMTPEQSARGLTLFNTIKDKDLPDIDSTKQGYPNLALVEAYKNVKSQ